MVELLQDFDITICTNEACEEMLFNDHQASLLDEALEASKKMADDMDRNIERMKLCKIKN